MDRRTWDLIVSAAGGLIAVALIVAGVAAIYGGLFGRANVTDRLRPERVSFPTLSAMTPQERAKVGDFAGARVDTGPEAEAFSRYISGHLSQINGGQTYAETSAAARQEGVDPQVAADLQAKADLLFRGETLRSIMLNAYGWWTIATIVLWVGIGMVIAGVVLAILALLGFRHARLQRPDASVSPVGAELGEEDEWAA